MACACKEKANKVQRLIPDIKIPQGERKGANYYLKLSLKTLWNIVLRLMVLAFTLVLILPLFFGIIIYSLFSNKEITVKLPNKFFQIIKKLDNNE